MDSTRTLVAGRVRFAQDETFSGLLVPLYARLRLPSTRLGFAQMNEALRARAEAEAAAAPSPAVVGAAAKPAITAQEGPMVPLG